MSRKLSNGSWTGMAPSPELGGSDLESDDPHDGFTSPNPIYDFNRKVSTTSTSSHTILHVQEADHRQQGRHSTTPSPIGSASSDIKLKGILKNRNRSKSLPHSRPTSRAEAFLEAAKENTLNFLNPMRRLDARKRILENSYKWWHEDQVIIPNYHAHQKSVHFDLDPVYVPFDALAPPRRNSIESDSRPGHSSEKPVRSLELRKWHKAAMLIGITLNLRNLAKRSSSDPEIDLISLDEVERREHRRAKQRAARRAREVADDGHPEAQTGNSVLGPPFSLAQRIQNYDFSSVPPVDASEASDDNDDTSSSCSSNSSTTNNKDSSSSSVSSSACSTPDSVSVVFVSS